jgi:O-antigen/teichoic acid export membrane protein
MKNRSSQLFEKLQLIFKGVNEQPLIKPGLGSLVLRGSNRLLTFFMGVLLVRALGLKGYGIYNFVLSFGLLMYILAEFGLPNFLIRETAKAQFQNEPAKMHGVWIWSFRFSALLLLILLVGAGLALFFLRDLIPQVTMETFLWCFLLVPAMTFTHLTSGVLQGLGRVNISQVTEQLIFPGLFTVTLLFSFSIGKNQLSASMAMAIRAFIFIWGLGFSLYQWLRKAPKQTRQTNPIFFPRVWLSSSASMALSSGLNLMYERLGVMILGFSQDASQVGVFQIAMHASLVAGLVFQSVEIVLAPRFAALYSAGQTKQLHSLILFSIRSMVAINLVITLIFFIWGKDFLSLIFGPEAIAAYYPLLILLVGQVIRSMTGPLFLLLNMTSYEKEAILGSGIAVIISLISNLILIPTLGVVGTAIAKTASLILAQFFLWWVVLKRLKINTFFIQFKAHEDV